jgi:2,5-diketo-D-gluconate reductase A
MSRCNDAGMPEVPYVTLNNGIQMPQLGFGVFQIPENRTEEAVGRALSAGYRSVDTAAAYRNERAVGAAITGSPLSREEVFVTTKLWNGDQGHDNALRAFEVSMERLALDYLDLYLIHWPVPAKNLYSETWRAFEELYSDGRTRAIGVSNFEVAHLQRLFDEHGIVPAVNQIELHPYLPQNELRQFHQEHEIATEAWSPIAQGAVLSDPTITAIAQRLHRTPAQVVLRWHIQIGTVAIPKSVQPSRIVENMEIFDFELSEQDLDAIAGLDRAHRTGPHPDTFGA